MVYKIIFKLVDIDVNEFFTLAEHVSTRGHRYRVHSKRYRVDVRKHSFVLRVTDPWNSLPADIVKFHSLSAFKTSIKNVDFSNFLNLRHNVPCE